MPDHLRTCNLCEAMCGLVVTTDGQRVVSVRGDAEDPFSRGHLCPKPTAYGDVHADPDRLRRPVKREGDAWVEVSWDEAFELAASRLVDVQRAHGRDAVATYFGNPTVHNHGALVFVQPFLKALGTRNRYSATSVDQLPHQFAAFLMFGHQLLVPIPDIDRTRFFLVMGANPAVSNGSMMSAPDVKRRMREIRERGGRVVVVDPRRTETARLADEHVPIRPGADALLLLAMLHVVFDEGLARPGHLAAFTDGVDAVREAAARYAPERVAEAVGIGSDEIRRLARAFAAAPSAVAYGRVGLSTQPFGGLCQWLINALNVVTGNLDREGGAMFTRPAFDVVGITARLGQRGHFGRRRSRVRGLPEFSGEYPSAALAEEIDTPGEGQVRALVTFAGNPVLSTPNGARLDRALASLDFMVCVDHYVNETTRHAHLILPPTHSLEHDHYDIAFHVLAVRNTAKLSPAVLEPPAGSRHDWQILAELARRIDAKKGRGVKAALAHEAMKRLGPTGVLDIGLRTGPHGGFGGLSVSKLRRAPHGVDLGPLKPCLPQRLLTKDKRVDLAPAPMLADLARLDAWLAEARAADLMLIGRRDLRSNNSWMHNSERLVKGGERCTLLMSPQDADRLKLQDGQRVRVASRVGRVEVELEVSDEMMPGVVSMPHGWGHAREGVRLRVAREHAGASVNDITDDARVDALTGNAAFSATPVTVEAA